MIPMLIGTKPALAITLWIAKKVITLAIVGAIAYLIIREKRRKPWYKKIFS